MKIKSAAAGIAFLGLVSLGEGCAAPQDAGPPMETPNPPGMTGGPGTNTDYPMAKPGFNVGDQVANLSFLAKVHGAQDTGQSPIKETLADFYAMRKQGAKLLFLSGAAEWCGPCNQEADGLVQALQDQGYMDAVKVYHKDTDTADAIQIVQVVLQNNDGSPSDRDTIDRWTKSHKMTFEIGIDPKSDVSTYIPANTIPQSLFIRLSDMTLLGRNNGYPGTAGIISSLESYLKTAAK